MIVFCHLIGRDDHVTDNVGDWVAIEIIVIDEVSMLKKTEWLQLDNLLRHFKLVGSVPFGGIHVILIEDFLQLPPVGADPPYLDHRCNQLVPTTVIETFEQFDTVIILVESVRFSRVGGRK